MAAARWEIKFVPSRSMRATPPPACGQRDTCLSGTRASGDRQRPALHIRTSNMARRYYVGRLIERGSYAHIAGLRDTTTLMFAISSGRNRKSSPVPASSATSRPAGSRASSGLKPDKVRKILDTTSKCRASGFVQSALPPKIHDCSGDAADAVTSQRASTIEQCRFSARVRVPRCHPAAD